MKNTTTNTTTRTTDTTAATLAARLVIITKARAAVAQTDPAALRQTAATMRGEATAAQTIADDLAAAYIEAVEKDTDPDTLATMRGEAVKAQDRADRKADRAAYLEAQADEAATTADRLAHGRDLIAVYRDRTTADDEADEARKAYEAAKRTEREALDDLARDKRNYSAVLRQLQIMGGAGAVDFITDDSPIIQRLKVTEARADLATAEAARLATVYGEARDRADRAAEAAPRHTVFMGATDTARDRSRAQTLATAYRTAEALADPAALDEADDLARSLVNKARAALDKARAAHRSALRRAAAPAVVVAAALDEAAAREAYDEAQTRAASILAAYDEAQTAAALPVVLLRVYWNITASGEHLEAQAQTIAARANKNALLREYTQTQQRIDRAARASDYTDPDYSALIAAAREALAAVVAPTTATTAAELFDKAEALDDLAAALVGVTTSETVARIFNDSRAARLYPREASTDRQTDRRRAAVARLTAEARAPYDEARAPYDEAAAALRSDLESLAKIHRRHRAEIAAEYKAARALAQTAAEREALEAADREALAAELAKYHRYRDPRRSALRTLEADLAELLATFAGEISDTATRAAFRSVNNYLTDNRAIRVNDRPAPLSLEALAAVLTDPAAVYPDDDEATERTRRLRENMRAALPAALDTLTKPARQVWRLYAQGYSTKAVARKLHRDPSTITEHLRNIAAALYSALKDTRPDTLEALAASYALDLATLDTLAAQTRAAVKAAAKREARATKREAAEAEARDRVKAARATAAASVTAPVLFAAAEAVAAELAKLPPVMREVFAYWEQGEAARATARRLSRSHVTILEHRAAITRKVRAAALAAAPALDLPDTADALKILEILA